jgi:hypothetical protein
MRILAAIMIGCGLLGVNASSVSAQRYSQSQRKVSASAFPLTAHVTGSHFSADAQRILFIDATINGQHERLETNVLFRLLAQGDYKARVASEHQDKDGSFSRTYELLFPDGSHHIFNVVGTSE